MSRTLFLGLAAAVGVLAGAGTSAAAPSAHAAPSAYAAPLAHTAPSAHTTPSAHAARSCGVGAGHGYGYSYLTSLSVTRTGCATGRTLARHHGRLAGWRCAARRLDTSSVQYAERVTCSSGARLVRWTFVQNT